VPTAARHRSDPLHRLRLMNALRVRSTMKKTWWGC
jgi:hypothetical protein